MCCFAIFSITDGVVDIKFGAHEFPQKAGGWAVSFDEAILHDLAILVLYCTAVRVGYDQAQETWNDLI